MKLKTLNIILSRAAYRRRFAVVLLVLTSILMFEVWLESLIEYRYQQEERLETLQRLNVVRSKLETIFYNNLSLIKGMGIAIAAKPDLDNDDFTQYAREIFRAENLLINFAAAPNLIVKYVYPLEGNEKVIGLNYLKNEKQKAGALKVRDSRSLDVIGPVSLVQGGQAFIGRAPIFYFDHISNKEHFWGILSSPMALDKVLNASGITELEKLQPVALRRKANGGSQSKLVFGQSKVFNEYAVITELSVGGEIWQLATQVNKDSDTYIEVITYIRFALTLILSLIGTIIFIRVRQNLERNNLVEQLKYRENILERVGTMACVGGWEYRINEGFTFWSTQIYQILEIENNKQFLTLTQLQALVSSKHIEMLKLKSLDLYENKAPIDIELQISCANQHKKWVHIQAHLVNNDDQLFVQGVVQDITERKNDARIILRQANYDHLTQLANRTLFDEKLELAVISAKRNQNNFSLLYIDLDRFKIVNDSLGHSIGDKLLIFVAQRFLSCIRESDVLSRRSGDEFTLLVHHLSDRESVERIAKNILNQLKEPFQIDEHQIQIGASIGITVFPIDGDNANQLLKNADQGMYLAKKLGRDRFCYFTASMQKESDRKLRLHIDMREALANNDMQVYYQPIINMATGKVADCEALIRWEHGELGFIPAQELVSLAEDVGFIQEIGQFVMHQALQDMTELNAVLGLDIGVALNKSYREFIVSDGKEPVWIEQLKQASKHVRITVEITESLLIENDEVYKILRDMRGFGIQVAIDDFGTGYSSLSYLRRFPVDKLKIDRSFVKDIDTDQADLALVDIILAMADNLAIKVVAEGAENRQQYSLLAQRNCDYCQGYYIARPMPKDLFEQWLKRRAC